MVKLRHYLHIYDKASFTMDGGEKSECPKMDYMQSLSSAYFSSAQNANKILVRTPNLRKLICEVLKFDGSFLIFDNLKKLFFFDFPSGVRYLHCSPTNPDSRRLGVTISSNTWKVNDEQFRKLKFLKLENHSFSEWDVSGGAFPCLEHLVLKRCQYLRVIPSRFEDMTTLKSIEVKSCKESLAESDMVNKEVQVEKLGN
ncbi:hypothetical protein BC332_27654 [Capsicum chinense]|nr:hypothetical protein BC332_27654 [Capsicum chinense]